MSLFSLRKGLKPARTAVQVDSIDEPLRVSLWNALTVAYWNNVEPGYYGSFLNDEYHRAHGIYFRKLWLDYFKKPLDSLQDNWPNVYAIIRQYFLSCPWYEVYDFLEFTTDNYPQEYPVDNAAFIGRCNYVLERELSAYRLVGGKITEITSESEIAEIDQALHSASPLKPVVTHLTRALDLLADRKSPDYRNSIKESISAIEALCRLVTSDPKASLGKAIKVIKGKVAIHPALERAFDHLYGYTSDEAGIRHSLLDEPSLGFEDAKFMLVSCSAFVNYIVAKSSKAGVKF